MDQLTISKEIPSIAKYDVVVCGGGPSGFIAAIAAARGGAKVALIESNGFLGGMATAGLVAPISNFRKNNELVIGGIPWEFVKRLEEAGGAKVEYPGGNVSFQPSLYMLIAQRMVIEAGAELYLHAFISGCRTDEENNVTHVLIESKSGTQAIEGEYFIDATGDGDIAHYADVPMQDFGTSLQPASMCFCLGGVDIDKLQNLHHDTQMTSGIKYIQTRFRELAASKDIPNFGGPWMNYSFSQHSVIVNMTRMEADMTNEREQTRAECALREDAYALVNLLRENFEEFKDAYIHNYAPQAGIRETRHILGMHVLTGEEYVNAFHFDDAIGRCPHPIDIHASKDSSQSLTSLKEAAYIPYHSLIAADFPNLLVPSRCFSADRIAFASARVQASVMGMGQAAGFAAAMCAQTDNPVQQVDVQLLRKTLMGLGANI